MFHPKDTRRLVVYALCMRTTLTMDDDILAAARERARIERRPLGAVISDLSRRALAAEGASGAPTDTTPRTREFFGFVPLPRRGGIITNELVNSIREEEGL